MSLLVITKHMAQNHNITFTRFVENGSSFTTFGQATGFQHFLISCLPDFHLWAPPFESYPEYLKLHAYQLSENYILTDIIIPRHDYFIVNDTTCVQNKKSRHRLLIMCYNSVQYSIYIYVCPNIVHSAILLLL